MQEYVLDECLSSLYKLELLMEDYVELSDYQVLFEADNPDVSAQMQKNASIQKESGGLLHKIANGILSLIKNIIDSITNFFKELFMGNNEQILYNQFREACAKDPSLKNKKVTVNDYKNAIRAYDEKIAEIDRELQKAADQPTASQELIDSCMGMIKNGVAATGAIVTSEVAVNMAYNNINIAKALQKALNDENSVMMALQKNLGEKEAKRFKKDIESLTKIFSFHKIKVQIMQKKYDTLQQCITGTLKQVSGLTQGKLFSNIPFLRKIFNNETLGPGAKKGVKIGVKTVASEAKKKIKSGAKRAFKGDYEDYQASGVDFVTGASVKKKEQANIRNRIRALENVKKNVILDSRKAEIQNEINELKKKLK